LKSITITITDTNGNEIKKLISVDDKGNIIDEKDVYYVSETFIDELGIIK